MFTASHEIGLPALLIVTISHVFPSLYNWQDPVLKRSDIPVENIIILNEETSHFAWINSCLLTLSYRMKQLLKAATGNLCNKDIRSNIATNTWILNITYMVWYEIGLEFNYTIAILIAMKLISFSWLWKLTSLCSKHFASLNLHIYHISRQPHMKSR